MLAFERDGVVLFHGDCLEVLAGFADGTIDSVVTDPPYELGFMGKAWDGTGIANRVDMWREVLRVLKPGGHLLAFGGTRTYHRMTVAIEDAGFEVRDSLHWLYGTGFPKSLNVGDGRGTALKPAHEPIVMARKPLAGTVAANVETHGTGALNIDATRIEGAPRNPGFKAPDSSGIWGGADNTRLVGYESPTGRWPANVLLSHAADCAEGPEAGAGCVTGCPVAELDAQSGTAPAKQPRTGKRGGSNAAHMSRDRGDNAYQETVGFWPGDAGGGASRFFYVSKPSRTERDLGCSHLPAKGSEETVGRDPESAGAANPRAGAGRSGGVRNYHPTVKPIALMRYLVRLVTPPGGVVLDPFTGSGTTGIAARAEGFNFVGVEREAEYVTIATARIGGAQ